MDYLELSIKSVEEKCNELYKVIRKNYDYDLVIFIAKGSYIIGKNIADLNKVPLLEIFAKRKGGKFKKIIKPLLKFVPKNILIKLRNKEMNSNYHERNYERSVTFDKSKYYKFNDKKRILLVDDSIDSGNSMRLVKSVIEEYFNNADVKVAVFNTMSKSIIKADYSLYENVMICGPWSNDSKENDEYLELYDNWRKDMYDGK